MRHVFPFNYVIPGQSTNTLLHFRSYCDAHPRLRALLPELQMPLEAEDLLSKLDNRFTASSYRITHFVVDLPLRVSREMLAEAPPAAWTLGSVVFAQTEFQVVDRETEQGNELGDASHSAYKDRQKDAVMRRLKLGTAAPTRRELSRASSRPTTSAGQRSSVPPSSRASLTPLPAKPPKAKK
jgi:uncharacterized protein (TIGR04552 family)